MDNQNIDKIISEYMKVAKIPLFYASDDGGSRYSFSNECRAVVQHFLEDDPNNYHTSYKIVDKSYYPKYSASLDLLVPVWEKLEVRPELVYDYAPDKDKYLEFCEVVSTDSNVRTYGYGSGETIAEASAHATAKCIISIGEEDA